MAKAHSLNRSRVGIGVTDVDSIPPLIAVGIVNLLTFPLIVWLIERFIGKRLDKMEESRNIARHKAEEEAKDTKTWRDAMESGMKSLLRAELLHEHNKWMRRGYCPYESKQYLQRLHEAYKGVGGNSIGDRLYEETIALPTNETEE